MPVEYGATLRFEDFEFDADVKLTHGEWNRIGAKTIEAGVQYAVGRRFDGYAVVILGDTAGTVMYGKVRVVASDPQEYRKVTVLEFNTRTTTDMGDKQKKKLVPLTMPWVKTDSKLILEVDPETTQALDYGNTLSAIDVTVKVL